MEQTAQKQPTLRPNDELEGALLVNSNVNSNILPQETTDKYANLLPIPPPSNFFSPNYETNIEVPEAVPLLAFEMDSTKENIVYIEEEQDDPKPLTTEDILSQVAQERTNTESYNIRTGTLVGERHKFVEHYEIQKANKDAAAKQYNESEVIRVANQVAKFRLKQQEHEPSASIDAYLISDANASLSSPSPIVPLSTPKKDTKEFESKKEEKRNRDEGYEVSEYEVSTYEGTEYNPDYEYKSIYD